MKPGADSKIWVILPAYNEERALPALLDSLLENLGRAMQPFFFIHLSVKWGEYLWPFTAELTPIWKRAIKRSKLP